MKSFRTHPPSAAGNALLITILLTGLIGFVLVAYLGLVSSQNATNARSQVWNSAIPVLEAGLEEGLAHLNAHGTTNLNCDGWTQSGNTYSMTRWIGQDQYLTRIVNFVAGTNSAPNIESFGYVVLPLMSSASPNAFLASVSVSGTANYLGRGVRLTTKQDFLFTKGMVAKDNIDLNGNSIETDSFDSTDPLYSTNGIYTSGRRKYNGNIATNSGLTNSLNVGNANIRGHVSTGPGGTVAIGPQGKVGDAVWFSNNGNQGIQPGHSSDDMNVDFPEVEPPFNGGAFTPTGGWVTNVTATVSGGTTNYTTNSVHYDYILDDGNWQLSTLNGSVYVGGTAVLYVTADLDISSLVIEPGTSLNLYCAAASASVSGNNTANSDGTADAFVFWGLPTCTSLTFSGNASFAGAIYAPSAAFTLNGSGNNVIDFMGASITKSVRMNGHFNFHYDEALEKIGPFRGWIVTSWNEMLPSEIPPAVATAY